MYVIKNYPPVFVIKNKDGKLYDGKSHRYVVGCDLPMSLLEKDEYIDECLTLQSLLDADVKLVVKL